MSARNSLVSSATSNDHATVASKLSSTAQRLGTFVIGVLLAVSLVPIAPVSAYADTSASAPAAAADNPTEVSEPAPTDVFVETSMEAPGPASAETSAVSSTQSDNHAVSVIFTNDVHCAIDHVDPGAKDNSGRDVDPCLGYAGVAAFANDARAQYGQNNVTLVDAGDAIQGGVAGTLTKGEALVELMNAAGYDYAVPGNHEFDYGMDQFLKIVDGKADYTYLSCNFITLGDKATVFRPYALEVYDEVSDGKDVANKNSDPSADGVLKVAYVGISTPETLTKSTPTSFQDEAGNYIYGFCEDSTGDALYNAVQKSVDMARADGADYVVAVGHLGKSGITKRWTSEAVIEHTTGIDAFIDGHSHEAYTEEYPAAEETAVETEPSVESISNEQGTMVPCVQTGTKLANVGQLVIDPSKPDDQDISVKLTSAEDYTETDATVEAAVDKVNNELKEQTEKVVGQSKVNLLSEDANTGLYVRYQETNLGDFVADAYRIRMGADIGLVNGGGVRQSLKAGDITKGDLINVQPYGNELCLVQVTGQTLLDALEMGVRNLPEPSGGFLQVSGVSYKVNTAIASPVKTDDHGSFVSADGDRRVYDVKVDGKPLDPTDTYTVASHGYMLLQGGDGMTMFQGDDVNVLQENVMIDNQALIDYMQEDLGGTIAEGYENVNGAGRIQLTDGYVEDPSEDEVLVSKDNGNGTKTVYFDDKTTVIVPNSGKVGTDSIVTAEGVTITQSKAGMLLVRFAQGAELLVPSGSAVEADRIVTPQNIVITLTDEGTFLVVFSDGSELVAPSGSSVSAEGVVTDADGNVLLPNNPQETADTNPSATPKTADDVSSVVPVALVACLMASGVALMVSRRRVALHKATLNGTVSANRDRMN